MRCRSADRAAAPLTRRLVLASLAALALPRAAAAHSYRKAAIAIGHAWGLPTTGAETEAFFALLNEGPRADRLIALASPDAQRVELREGPDPASRRERLDLPPGRPIPMRPGARHVRLIGLARPLVHGDRVRLRLTFEQAGAIEVEVWIEPAPYAPR